jgi:hypothetical protein
VKGPQDVALRTIDISVNGQWQRVPALCVSGKNIVVKGKWIRLAVVSSEEWLETELDDPDACVRRLKERESELCADIFTFGQKPPSMTRKYSYPAEVDSVAVACTTSFKRWWDDLPQETRKNVRRAQKRGVVLKVRQFSDDLVREIIDVNNDSPVRQNESFVHYGKTFEQVKKDHCSYHDRSDFVCAYVGEEPVGFLKVVYRGDVASILQILPKPSHADKRPANALIAKAVELCEEKRISHLTYGLYNYGNKRDSPLREFKIRNGFAEMLLPRYYVPLTPWGVACVKLGLHRGLLGILPHRVITMGINARTRWNRARHRLFRA